MRHNGSVRFVDLPRLSGSTFEDCKVEEDAVDFYPADIATPDALGHTIIGLTLLLVAFLVATIVTGPLRRK